MLIFFASKNNLCADNNLRNDRQILITTCDNYLEILPRQLGCYICQICQKIINSEQARHYYERVLQINKLKKIIYNPDSKPQEILDFVINYMGPFKGKYGRNFCLQVKLILEIN